MKIADLKLEALEQYIVHTALAHFIESGEAGRIDNPGENRVSIIAHEKIANRIADRIEANLNHVPNGSRMSAILRQSR